MDIRLEKWRAQCAALVATVIIGWGSVVRADRPERCVRPVGPYVADMIARGAARSRTMAGLLDALEQTDVIVHIEERQFAGGRVLGETRFVGVGGGRRYLRIYVHAGLDGDEGIALLAHELQHALEIAEAEWVVDIETLWHLYTMIGYQTDTGSRARGVDTMRARDTGRHVLKELRGSGLAVRRPPREMHVRVVR